MEENIDSLVRRVVNHPSFREAVNNTDANSPGTSASSTASSSCGTPQSSSNTQQRTQTPRQELQSLFRRGSSQNDALPEFQQRTCWGPARSGSRFLRHETRGGRKADPYSKNAKGKHLKNATFSREIVLLPGSDATQIVVLCSCL